MKKIFLLVFLSALFVAQAYAQDEVSGNQTQKRDMPPPPEEPKEPKQGPSFKDRVSFGGSIGLQFGSYTFIDVSPLMAYRFSPKLIGGVGITYRYVSYDYRTSLGTQTFEDHQYGWRVFGRYFVIPQLFAHIEYESLNLTSQIRLQPDGSGGFSEERSRSWVNSAFVGAGYFQGAGKNAGVFVMVLYNLIDCTEFYCPYPDRWLIRVGVMAGF